MGHGSKCDCHYDEPNVTPMREGPVPDVSSYRLKFLAGINLTPAQARELSVIEKSAADKLQVLKGTGYTDIDEFLKECLDTMSKKGHDYRQGNDDDLLHNFRTVGDGVEIPMEKVWFTYFYKHYSALVTYIKKSGQSESEPIEGRIKDMIVYLLLFYRMIQEQKTNKVSHLGEIAKKADEKSKEFARLKKLTKGNEEVGREYFRPYDVEGPVHGTEKL